MDIAPARVASFHYTLTDEAGKVIDKSPEARPMRYLHGAGNIVPGLEKALAGKSAGDSLDVAVKPEEAYGVRNEGLVQDVPREAFKGIDKIEPGMQFQAQANGGTRLITVAEVGDSTVRVDGNHPLAGRTLHFAVEVTEVREASDEEKQQGHPA